MSKSQANKHQMITRLQKQSNIISFLFIVFLNLLFFKPAYRKSEWIKHSIKHSGPYEVSSDNISVFSIPRLVSVEPPAQEHHQRKRNGSVEWEVDKVLDMFEEYKRLNFLFTLCCPDGLIFKCENIIKFDNIDDIIEMAKKNNEPEYVILD